MADNVPITPGSGRSVASDQVSYSGDTADVQLMRLVGVSGAEGSKTVIEPEFAVTAGRTVRVSANFNRPADTVLYSIGDLVANSTTAASVVPLTFNNVVRAAGGTGLVRRAKLRKNNTTVANAVFRLHLFQASPVITGTGDNGIFSTVVAGGGDYIGSIDFTLAAQFNDGSVDFGVPRNGAEIAIDLAAGTTLYGLLEARAGYTPVSGETFTVDLEIQQD